MSAAYKIPTEIYALEPARAPRVAEPKPTAALGRDLQIVPSDVMTNAELALLMRSDPVAAAPIVYARFGPRIHRLVQCLVGQDADRHDLVQHVFHQLIERGINLRDPEKLPAWIHAFTVNMVYAEFRRRRARTKHMAAMIHDSVRDLVGEVETRDLLEHARAALDRLPVNERVAFTLCVAEGLTMVQAAAVVGCSKATIKRRVERASRHFRNLMRRRTGIVLVDPRRQPGSQG